MTVTMIATSAVLRITISTSGTARPIALITEIALGMGLMKGMVTEMYEELISRLKNLAMLTTENGKSEIRVSAEAIQAIREIASEAADAIEELDTLLDGVEADNDALCETIERLKKPRWIPATETPPLKVGDDGYNGYLVYANGYYEVADYTTDKIDNVPYFHVDGEYEPDVTHYMPLPEPPKEETK